MAIVCSSVVAVVFCCRENRIELYINIFHQRASFKDSKPGMADTGATDALLPVVVQLQWRNPGCETALDWPLTPNHSEAGEQHRVGARQIGVSVPYGTRRSSSSLVRPHVLHVSDTQALFALRIALEMGRFTGPFCQAALDLLAPASSCLSWFTHHLRQRPYSLLDNSHSTLSKFSTVRIHSSRAPKHRGRMCRNVRAVHVCGHKTSAGIAPCQIKRDSPQRELCGIDNTDKAHDRITDTCCSAACCDRAVNSMESTLRHYEAIQRIADIQASATSQEKSQIDSDNITKAFNAWVNARAFHAHCRARRHANEGTIVELPSEPSADPELRPLCSCSSCVATWQAFSLQKFVCYTVRRDHMYAIKVR